LLDSASNPPDEDVVTPPAVMLLAPLICA